MSQWLYRTVLSGSSVDENGTNSHTCTFTAATSGNQLVAIVASGVTCSTPTGWTLVTSAVNNFAVYVFTKTASSGESSFSTTHNSSNFLMKGVVYEFPAGTSVIGSNSATGQAKNTGVTGPQVSSLTGTYTRFAARVLGSDRGDTTFSCAWTLPSVEDYDSLSPRVTNDGIGLTIAYDDNSTGSSFNPSSNITSTLTNYTDGEGVAFALSVAFSATSVSWII